MIPTIVIFIGLHNYSTILLSLFIIPCIRSLWLIIYGGVCTLKRHQSYPPCPDPLVITILFSVFFTSLTFLDFTYKWYHVVFACLYLISHLAWCAQGPPMVSWIAGKPPFSWLNNINIYIYIIYIPYLFCPFSHW